MVRMKEMSVYKAEVFRRSKERIAARRRTRNRVLAFCIPLCLIIGIWSAMILPAMLPAGSEDFSPEEESADGVEGSLGSAIPYTDVKIELLDFSDDAFQQYSDASDVNKLYALINSVFFTHVMDDESNEQKQESAGGANFENEEATDSNKKMQCRIVFFSPDGNEKSYLLDSNTLTDELTGKKEILTENELNALKVYVKGN